MATAPAETKQFLFKLRLPTISLPFKKKVAEPISTPSNTPSPLSKEAEELTNKTLAQLIDDKLDQFGGKEFLVIKINKQGLLIFIGIILVAIWLRPLVRTGQTKITNGEWSIQSMRLPAVTLPQLPFIKKTPATTPLVETPAPEATPSGIRVRMGTNASASAEMIKQLLTTGGFTQIDVVFDETVNANQVLIATHSGTNDLGQQLAALFNKSYKTASSSATLTEDSNFAATILVGKNSLKKR